METKSEKNYFEILNDINVSDYIEKKGRLSYLSWAYAWREIKKRLPETNYRVYENADGWNYFTDGRTAWVKVGVTANGIEHIEYLPVMDNQNRSIAQDKVTSFNVNTSIQRALTKAIARHGLGLYIYAGEDLPEGEKPVFKNEEVEKLHYLSWMDTYFANHKNQLAPFLKKYGLDYLENIDKKLSLQDIDEIISNMKASLEKEKASGGSN